jgi:predicted alpha/beta hydrolase
MGGETVSRYAVARAALEMTQRAVDAAAIHLRELTEDPTALEHWRQVRCELEALRSDLWRLEREEERR